MGVALVDLRDDFHMKYPAEYEASAEKCQRRFQGPEWHRSGRAVSAENQSHDTGNSR